MKFTPLEMLDETTFSDNIFGMILDALRQPKNARQRRARLAWEAAHRAWKETWERTEIDPWG